MLDNPVAEALLRSLMLGTARQPTPSAIATALQGLADPGDPKVALKALALVGQRQKFRRPARIGATPVSVSYTHLTLPTIYSV